MGKILILVYALIFCISLSAQSYNQAHYWIHTPTSLHSIGMGEQGVALFSTEDAQNYNPANLIYSHNISIGYFKRTNKIFGYYFPLSNLDLSANIKNIGAFGFEIKTWDYGETFTTSPESPEPIGKSESFDRSYALGFARNLSPGLALGSNVKYVYNYYGNSLKGKSWMFGIGLNYKPRYLKDRMSIGASLMNLSSTVTYKEKLTEMEPEFENAPPTVLHLGVYGLPLKNDYFNIGVQIGLSKYFAGDKPKSSFELLFSDWQDFPEDLKLSTGMNFKWEKISLGKGFYIFQEFAVGNSSQGYKESLTNFYTHSASIGMGYKDYEFIAGYAGYWHNVHYSRYLQPIVPWETFKFSFKWNGNILNSNLFEQQSSKIKPAKNVVISTGMGYSKKLGQFSKIEDLGYSITRSDELSYYLLAEFELNNNFDLIAKVSYSPFRLSYKTYYVQHDEIHNYVFNIEYESFAVTSLLRYNPVNLLKNLFIQSGIGVWRWNPTYKKTNPRYTNNPLIETGFGYKILLWDHLYFSPTVSWLLTLVKTTGSAPRLQGYNQIDFALMAGYKF